MTPKLDSAVQWALDMGAMDLAEHLNRKAAQEDTDYVPLTEGEMRAYAETLDPRLLRNPEAKSPAPKTPESLKTAIEQKKTAEASRLDVALREFKALLGPLVNPWLRTTDGDLDLSKIKAKNFSEFKSFLKTQVSIDGIAFNQAGLDSYQKVLDKKEYEGLLFLLYREVNPQAPVPSPKDDPPSKGLQIASLVPVSALAGFISQEASPVEDPNPTEPSAKDAAELVRKFIADLIEVSPEHFVGHHLDSVAGRNRLAMILKDPNLLELKSRADLIKAIGALGDQRGISPLHSYQLNKLLSSYDLFNWWTDPEKVGKALVHAEAILEDGNEYFQVALEQQQKYLESPRQVRVFQSELLQSPIAYQDVRRMAQMVEETGSFQDPLNQLKSLLARMWLMAADNKIWVYPENDGATEKNRACLLNHLSHLIFQAERVYDLASFQKFHDKLQKFLKGPKEDGSSAALNWIRHKTWGNGLGQILVNMPSAYQRPYQELLQYSDEIAHAQDMEEPLALEAGLIKATDPGLHQGIEHLILGLERSKRSLWHGFKQHKLLSRVGSGIAESLSFGDIRDIRAANQQIDAMISRLRGAGSKEEVAAEFQILFEGLKEEGPLHRALAAAEMDGVEQLIGITQTVGIYIGVNFLFAGLGTVTAVGRAGLAAGRAAWATRSAGLLRSLGTGMSSYDRIRGAQQLMQFQGQAAEALGHSMQHLSNTRWQRFIQNLPKMMSHGAKMGAVATLAENSLAVLSGEVRACSDSALSWTKDSMATGLAMALFGPISMGAIPFLGSGNMLSALMSRYFGKGWGGLLHLGRDSIAETAEEMFDATARRGMDGQFEFMGMDQAREIALVSSLGGAKMGVLGQGFRRIRSSLRSPKFNSRPKRFGLDPSLGALGLVLGVGLGGFGKFPGKPKGKGLPKEVPQMTPRLDIDEASLKSMETFPGKVAETYGSDEANQVHFAMNHLKWWIGLIQRDVAQLGSEAIVEGGKILFGRWLENPAGKFKSIEGQLRNIAGKAQLSLVYDSPEASTWWRPLWEKSLAAERRDPALLAAILQEVRAGDVEAADQWFAEVAQQDVDLATEIEMALEDQDSREPGTVSEEFRRDLNGLLPLMTKGDPEGFNLRLKGLYLRALSSKQLSENYDHLLALWESAETAARYSENEAKARNAAGRVNASSHGSQAGDHRIAAFNKEVEDMLKDQGFLPIAIKSLLKHSLAAQFHRLFEVTEGAEEVQERATKAFEKIYEVKLMDERMDAVSVGEYLLSEGSDRNPFFTENYQHVVKQFHQNDFSKKVYACIEQGDLTGALALIRSHKKISVKALALYQVAKKIAENGNRPDKAKGIPLGREPILLEPGKKYRVGQDPKQNDLIIDHHLVGDNHLEIQIQYDDLVPVLSVKDLGSRQGTLVGYRGSVPVPLLHKEVKVKNGDRIVFSKENFAPTLEVQIDPKTPVGYPLVILPMQNPHRWVIQAQPSETGLGATAAGKKKTGISLNSPKAGFASHKDHFAHLPTRPLHTVPQEHRHLIPKPQDIVLFPRFQRILQETASLITAPDRIGVRFFGPPGTSKTTLPEMIAHKMGVPLLRMPFSKRTDPSDLEGLWEMALVEGQYVPVFREGAATTAMERGYHLVLDEPDLARPGVLAFINNVSAPGEYAWVRKRDGGLHRIEVHEGYRVYATENGAQEIGREEHGKDFIRRFVPYYVGPWTQEEVAEVLAQVYEKQDGRRNWDRKTTQTLAYFHDQMRLLAEGLVDEETGEAVPPLGSGIGQQVGFTPRSALRLAQRLVSLGEVNPENLSRAIRSEYILPLADPQDRELVWSQAQAIFGELLQAKGFAENALGPDSIPDPTRETISQKFLGGRDFPKNSFVWTDQALRLTEEILWNQSLGVDVMLLGEAGEGKTELPPQIAKLLQTNYYQKTVSSETDEEDLVGGPGRTNGRIEHIPDIVHLGTENGGVVHLDEYLLSDTGKLESVMNPLMDATRALILKNPYRLVPRDPKTFLIFTSNPPFGEYADRQEHSGAAMSRVATIYLTDEFAMGPKDRRDIMKSWLSRPLALGNAKKKASNALRKMISPAERLSLSEPEQGDPERSSTITIHPEIRERFDLPHQIVAEPTEEEGKKTLMEVWADGSKRPLSEATLNKATKYAKYLTLRTQREIAPITKRVFKILYTFAGDHVTSLNSKQIRLNLIRILTMKILAALGVGKHEWAHATIDRGSKKYDAFEAGRLYANVVGDPRMNNYVASLRGDFAKQIDVLYEDMWPKELSEKEQELFLKEYLPHEQFAHAIIHYWRHGEIMPWLKEEAVKNALAKALPILEQAFTLFPESTQDPDVDVAAARFYEILDEAYPLYKELFPDSLKEIADRLEAGEKPEDLARPPAEMQDLAAKASQPDQGSGETQGEVQAAAQEEPQGTESQGKMSKEEIQKLSQEIFDKRSEKMADRFEPTDPEALKKRKDEIAKAQGKAPPSEAESEKKPSEPPDKPEDVQPLRQEEFKKMEAERQRVLKERVQNNLFMSMVPASAIRAARKLKRILPPEDPSYLEGWYTRGKKLDREKSIQDQMKPVPDGKVMKKRVRPGDRDAKFVKITDITASITHAGAQENVVKSSAAATFLSEELKMDYGEILLGEQPRVAKPLGKPLKTYPKKNELLNIIQQSFYDPDIIRRTNIRAPLALAIEWIKAKPGRSNYILLITDGRENVVDYPKTLHELQAEADAAGIHLMVLAMGEAQRFVPHYFKNYQFVQSDGRDIPDATVTLFEEAHKKRVGGR